MFRKLGDLIHRTPWWGVLAGGLFVLVALAMFALPVHVLRLSDHAKTAEERSAIKREINLAFGDRALDIAQSVVGSMRERATDPERRRELEQALKEMDRARKELSAAQLGTASEALESAHERAESAFDAATTAAESALESASDAREALEGARDEAIEKLREKGIDTKRTAKSFEDMLRSARETEANARDSLASLRALRHSRMQASAKAGGKEGKGSAAGTPSSAGSPSPQAGAPAESAPAPSSPSGATPTPDANAGGASTAAAAPTPDATADTRTRRSRMSIDLDLPRKLGRSPLPADVRQDIRAKVASDVWRVGVGSALIVLFIPLFIMLVIAKYYIGRSRRALAFAEEKKQEARVSDVNRQITEARLQALQAQVEPHFLYNTLANVQALTEADPQAANAMVGHLIQYLRAALPKMRQTTSTIGQEIELVTAYLNVLRMRMGSRLEFGIDVPADLLDHPFPPLMLPSLVENAIKHGLEPLREGGRIDVVVRRTADGGSERIHVQVKDTGRGLNESAPVTGGGVGLANLRERLQALYGDDARFTLEANAPAGVVATIDIPAGSTAMRDPASAAGGVDAQMQQRSGSFAAAGAASPLEPGLGAAGANGAPSGTPIGSGWRRAWQATSRTHSIWAKVASRVFLGLMMLLATVFLIMLVALYTGHMPMHIAGMEFDGLEGMAVGSIVLLVGFAMCAIAVAIVVAVFYGLGFVLAGLLLLVPVIILVSLFPVLAPFVVIGLLVYWLWRRQRKPASSLPPSAPGGP